MSSSGTDYPKIPKLTNAKRFALWRLYGTELLREDVLRVLNESSPPPTVSVAVPRRWDEDDRKPRLHIVLNLNEEPATIITALIISNASTKEVRERLCNTYQRQNIQSRLNLRD